jgi:hypothetical protein
MTACVLVWLLGCLLDSLTEIHNTQDCQHLIGNMAQNSFGVSLMLRHAQPSRVDARRSQKVTARNDSDDVAKLGPKTQHWAKLKKRLAMLRR